MDGYSYIREQLSGIKSKIAELEKSSGRAPGSVKLIAVSKTFSADCVRAAYDAGQRVFGENRVQELEEKSPRLPDDIEWHVIGHLQSNKALKAVTLASYIHSIDSVKLLQRLDRLAAENKKRPGILLEINVSGEASKFGIADMTQAMLLGEEALKCANLDFRGLMTMAPLEASGDEIRSVFSSLRELRDRMEAQFGVKIPELSMGMSSDYEAAIREGATFVRIGTAIFGRRA